MIPLGGFIIRDAAAAVLFAMALGKIIAPRMAATQAWRPSWVPSGLALAAIFMLAITEMLLSIAVLLAPAPRWIIAVPVAIFFGLVTSYGLTAIARTGSCGCGGIAAAQIRKSTLIRRKRTHMLRIDRRHYSRPFSAWPGGPWSAIRLG